MKLDSRHILILLGLTSALSSCVQFSGQEGMAQLYPPVFEVDATVEDLAQTKAAPEPDAPALSDIHFTVKDKDGNEVYKKLGVWDAPLKLPIGKYSIEAYSGKNTFGTAYFTGTAEGTIEGGEKETPEITMKLQNAYLAVGLTETLAPHFKTSGDCITISTASARIVTGLDTYVFVPSGQELSIAIAGTSSADMPKTITHSLTARTAATATYLSCDMTTTDAPKIKLDGTPEAWGTVGYIPVATTENISEANVAKMKYFASSNEWTDSVDGTIVDVDGEKLVKFTGLTPGATYKVRAQIGALKSKEVSMTMSTSALSIKTAAAHTYTNKELDGTDFTASFSVAKKFGVTASSLQLCKTDGTVLTVLRKVALNGTSAEWTSDGSALTGSKDWPFLPGGTYILKGTATQNGSTVTLEEYKFTVPDTPDFTVSVSGKTTYDYSKTDINKANSLVAETIYEVGYSVSGISNKLLNNSNYGLSCQYAININGNSKNVTPTDGTITGCSWGVNNLTATVTFAGTQKTSSKLCDITGLPYRAPEVIKFNDKNHGWQKQSGDGHINADSFDLSTLSDPPQANSPYFYIPSAIKISISNKYTKNTGSWGSYTYSVKIAGSTEIINHSSNKQGTYTLACNETTLTNDKNYLSCHYSYRAKGNDVTVNTMIINYK